jgi:hypothetical protein
VGPTAGLDVSEKGKISYTYRDSSPGPSTLQLSRYSGSFPNTQKCLMLENCAVYCTVYCTVLCTVYCLLFTVLCTVYCTVYCVLYCVLFTVLCTVLCTVYCTVYCLLYCVLYPVCQQGKKKNVYCYSNMSFQLGYLLKKKVTAHCNSNTSRAAVGSESALVIACPNIYRGSRRSLSANTKVVYQPPSTRPLPSLCIFFVSTVHH